MAGFQLTMHYLLELDSWLGRKGERARRGGGTFYREWSLVVTILWLHSGGKDLPVLRDPI